MTEMALKTYFEKLSDKIMRSALTPEQAVSVLHYLRRTYSPKTDAGKVYSKVMIDTGAGESLMMIAQFANGQSEPEQFARDFVKLQ